MSRSAVELRPSNQANFFNLIDDPRTPITPDTGIAQEGEMFLYRGKVYPTIKLDEMLDKLRSFGYAPSVPEVVLEAALGIENSQNKQVISESRKSRRRFLRNNRSHGVNSPIDGASHMVWSNRRAWSRRG